MKKIITVAFASVATLSIIIGATYNTLVNKQKTVSESFGQVQADYQRRLDLIPNLVIENKIAYQLWLQAIKKFISGEPSKTEHTFKRYPLIIFSFESIVQKYKRVYF